MKRQSYADNRRKLAARLRTELRGYEDAGTQLYLEGRPSRADEIVTACLFAENASYMRDIISDETERITEINFVRLRIGHF